jgi:PAS domain S-box-containing protein
VARTIEPEFEELHQTEERLRAVIDSAPVGILEVDLQSRVIRWNSAAERIFGWSREEIVGRPVPIVPPAKRAEFENVLATVRSGRVFPNVETYRQRKDGTLVDVEIAAAPVRDSGGRVVSHMVVFTDISKRKRQQRELRASRARIVEAGDAERRRLERNLHDGAQQRLIALSLDLGRYSAKLDDDAEARARIQAARAEIATSLEELRTVARGLHPAVLSGHGLGVALESLAAASAVPVRLNVGVENRLDESIEVAAYYVVAESLANIGKHARATLATVDIDREGDDIVVEVVDDGIGGADSDRGSGLRGLADRVEALGGRLMVWTPSGGGTRVRAQLPCA